MRTRTKVIAGGAAGLFALAALLGGGAPDVLEVKGLRLGMPIEEAARVMEGHGFEVGGKADKLDDTRLAGEGWNLFLDGEQRVNRIELWPEALAKLFGTGDTTVDEFAASFASAYGVPLESTARVMGAEMAVITGNFLDTGWAFVNRDAGWAVKISEHRVLEIRAITPSAKQSFD
jgi:hypothetical protein